MTTPSFQVAERNKILPNRFAETRNQRILRTRISIQNWSFQKPATSCNPDLFTYMIPFYSILAEVSWTSIKPINTWNIKISILVLLHYKFYQCSCTIWTRSFSKTSISINSWTTSFFSPKHPPTKKETPPNYTKLIIPIPILRAPGHPILQLPTAGARRRQLLAQGVLALAEATHLLAVPRSSDLCHRDGCSWFISLYVCNHMCMNIWYNDICICKCIYTYLSVCNSTYMCACVVCV